MPDLLTAALATTSVGLLGTTALATALWRRSAGLATARKVVLDDTMERARDAESELDDLSEHHKEAIAALEASESRRRAALDAREQTDAALREVQSRLRRSVDVIDQSGAAQRRAEAESKRLNDRLEQLGREIGSLTVANRHARQVLRALGVQLLNEHHDPLAGERRESSRQALRRLIADTDATATVFVGSDGLPALAAGDESGIERLAAQTAWLSELLPAFGQVLCEPIASISLMDRRFCTHVLSIPGTGRFLALENQGPAPLFTLRRTHLDLVGLPEPPSPVTGQPDSVIDLDVAPDEALGAKLSRWAERYGAHEVTVLDERGRPLAATPTAQPGQAMSLRRAMTPGLLRLLRDGSFLDDVLFIARSEPGTTIAAQLAGPDLDAPMVAVLAPDDLTESALQQLVTTVSWHTRSTSITAQKAS